MYCLMETESESVSGSVDNMNVGYELQLVYKAADPHTYSLDFTEVEIEWFLVDAYGDDVSVGTKTIWNKGDQQVFWGPYPSGPNADGNMLLGYSFWYPGLDATPPDSRAWKFRLIFHGNIDGDDTYDTSGDMYYQTDITPIPGVTPIIGEEPEVTINHVYWWRELDHLMVKYTIDGKDGDNIVSTAELTDGNKTCTMESLGGEGSKEVSINAYDYRSMLDSGTVDVTIYYRFSIGGAVKETEYTETCSVEEKTCSLTSENFSVDGTNGSAEIDCDLILDQDGDDPHDYNLEFREIRVFWYYAGDDTPADEQVIWDGSGSYPFSGSGTDFNYSDTINVTPPNTDYRRFSLQFYATAAGNDPYDGDDEIDLYHDTDIWQLSSNY